MTKQVVTRKKFTWFFELQTRWSDNDMYGHINNAMYYSYLDTVISEFIGQTCQFEIKQEQVMSVVVNSQCDYFQSVAYPSVINIGIAVEHIGTKSVKYSIGFFKDDQDISSAVASLTEVWVTKKTGISVEIPENLKKQLTKYLLV